MTMLHDVIVGVKDNLIELQHYIKSERMGRLTSIGKDNLLI